jgi:two-component system response regulator TctD
MARLLVVEDDRFLARGLSAALRALGFSIDVAHDGARPSHRRRRHSASRSTSGLPDESGFDVLKRMRRAGDKTPVIILTARDAIEDRITGLDLGADDYVFKPFEVSELAARTRALLRRAQGEASPEIHVGSLCFDGVHGEARVGERRLELRPREWVLLERLVARRQSCLEGSADERDFRL